MTGQQCAEGALVAQFTCLREFYILRSALHEELQNVFMSEVACNHVRRSLWPEDRNIDGASAARILFRKILLRDTRPDALWVGIEVPAHQLQIAQSGSHEDVGPATGGHQMARDVLAIAWIMPRLNNAQHVLG